MSLSTQISYFSSVQLQKGTQTNLVYFYEPPSTFSSPSFPSINTDRAIEVMIHWWDCSTDIPSPSVSCHHANLIQLEIQRQDIIDIQGMESFKELVTKNHQQKQENLHLEAQMTDEGESPTCLLSHYNLGGLRIKSQDIPTLLTAIHELQQSATNQKDLPQLMQIQLWGNSFSRLGWSHLSKADWTNLYDLNLDSNNLGDIGCLYISMINFHELRTLSLKLSSIKEKGMRNLSKAECPKLHHFNLGFNSIGYKGCQALVHLNCPQLQKLFIPSNSVLNRGCREISKGNWSKTLVINLEYNQIGVDGYRCLPYSKWEIKCEQKYKKEEEAESEHEEDSDSQNEEDDGDEEDADQEEENDQE